jgi:N-acetylglucosamine-6-phosphate deacetylase
MTPLRALLGARVHTGRETIDDVAVLVEGGTIVALVPTREAPRTGVVRLELGGAHLAPGFVDLQVNGGGGVMLNDEPSADAVRHIARAHRRFGTTALLPTYISGSNRGMRDAARAVAEVMRAAPRTSGVLGVHFEGPFLDPRRPGAHDVRFLRAPTPPDLDVILGAAASLDGTTALHPVVMLTLAAQHLVDETAAELLAAGVWLSVGHCGATAAEARAAFGRGATLVTHLFNAMSPLTSREGGLVGAALDAAAQGRVRCGLILDGVHVAYDIARVATRAAGPGGVFLVTDAVSPVGAPPGSSEFELGGQRVRVQDGRCVNDAGVLAGSALDMASAVRNAARHLGVDLDEALRMAATYPAEAVGLGPRKGRIAPGYDADLVWFDDEVRVLGTLVGGELEPAGR